MSTWRGRVVSMVAAGAVLLAVPNGAATATTSLVELLPGELCVTEGAIVPVKKQLSVEAPKMRAVATIATATSAEIKFKYVGPTATTAPLRSGQVRRQIGLKLRAEDTCNVIYVMWRLAPVHGVAVSIKRNPGMSTYNDCTNGGYRNVVASHKVNAPLITVGSSHTLRAVVVGEILRVYADNVLTWEGNIGSDGAALAGPVGIRTDNARFDFTMYAGPPTGVPFNQTCGASAEE